MAYPTGQRATWLDNRPPVSEHSGLENVPYYALGWQRTIHRRLPGLCQRAFAAAVPAKLRQYSRTSHVKQSSRLRRTCYTAQNIDTKQLEKSHFTRIHFSSAKQPHHLDLHAELSLALPEVNYR